MMGLLDRIRAAIDGFQHPPGYNGINGYCEVPRCVLDYGHEGPCDWA